MNVALNFTTAAHCVSQRDQDKTAVQRARDSEARMLVIKGETML